MRYIPMLGVVVSGVLLACGGGGDGADGALAGRIAAACQASTNMEKALCDCVGEEAGRELPAKAQQLLLAMLEEDMERAETLRGEVSIEEAMTAGTFMVRAPATCARRGVGAPAPEPPAP